MKTLFHIVGTRPNYIKLGSLFSSLNKEFVNIIVDTGQHYDPNLSKIFYTQLEIPPPLFSLKTGSGTHGYQTGQILQSLEKILLTTPPDGVIIYGDVNSSLAGALAASKLNIPIFHIEAGGRSFDKTMPEEINRIIIDNISTINYCIEDKHLTQLNKEGIYNGVLVGNVQVDSVYRMLKNFNRKTLLTQEKFYICTLHRPFNTDNSIKLNKILNKLNTFSYPVIFPLHPRLNNKITPSDYPNIKIIPPLSYIDFLNHIYYSQGVISDSGGVQCDTAVLKKPLLTLRPTTEHLATLNYNNTLVDIETLSESSFNIVEYDIPEYWDGNASNRIKNNLIKYYNNEL